ncbi:dihydrofolate reductase family protein [Corynebacterium uberis]|uniref:dihydrofolate reductase family protein n=1 Tax=Corynebacterium TaxID=1716 RepID=UPI001D09F895|nr:MULTISPECIES: dihydrofolate reductase family protein [Corynebacterium]MCZ9308529.1 dihydrofolate reductase family protein [Corynebacterium sp. c6VSa_13]UDL74181.1 dihydrofolate reductase family protein [Corynebacterium uberis]UDL74935.1 dihydrofolate reductase family protein [Corynebacterium uberis]UDL77150.1 dihydrofolate reductase family protein [Corynebacterium uberis]UDL81564.1 dihydrofolate reductase family protein [Corynebacterium uberis]
MSVAFCVDPTVADLIGPTAPVGHPEVRAVAIMAATGSATVQGRSGTLGTARDSALLAGLRSWADAIVVTGATVRNESYGPVDVPAQARRERVARGQRELPVLCVVSRKLEWANLPAGVVVTSEEAAASISADRLRADGWEVLAGGSDPIAALRPSYPRILVEGGPHLYADLLARELIDVFHLTVSPALLPSVDTPLVAGHEHKPPVNPAPRWRLDGLAADADAMVYARYRRPNPAG